MSTSEPTIVVELTIPEARALARNTSFVTEVLGAAAASLPPEMRGGHDVPPAFSAAMKVETALVAAGVMES